MTLYEKIIAIYPELTQKDFYSTIRLQDDSDGKGAYIKEWNHSLPKPTDKQLA